MGQKPPRSCEHLVPLVVNDEGVQELIRGVASECPRASTNSQSQGACMKQHPHEAQRPLRPMAQHKDDCLRGVLERYMAR